jgi:hypothetical protein
MEWLTQHGVLKETGPSMTLPSEAILNQIEEKHELKAILEENYRRLLLDSSDQAMDLKKRLEEDEK